MRSEPHLVSGQDAPAKIDFLRNFRQYDEPLVSLIPCEDSWIPYQIWREWLLDAINGEQILYSSLHRTTINAHQTYINSGLSSPCWPAGVLAAIDAALLSTQTKKFLLSTSAGLYLFSDCERRAEAARGRGMEVATR